MSVLQACAAFIVMLGYVAFAGIVVWVLDRLTTWFMGNVDGERFEEFRPSCERSGIRGVRR